MKSFSEIRLINYKHRKDDKEEFFVNIDYVVANLAAVASVKSGNKDIGNRLERLHVNAVEKLHARYMDAIANDFFAGKLKSNDDDKKKIASIKHFFD